jgi:hypothetical protein
MPRSLRLILNLNINSLATLLLVTPLQDILLLKDTLPRAILNLVTLLHKVLTHLSTPSSHSTHLSRLLILDSIHLLDILSSLPAATKLPQATRALVVLLLNIQVVTLLSQEFLNLATPATLPSNSPTLVSTLLKGILPVDTINDELLNYYLIHANT